MAMKHGVMPNLDPRDLTTNLKREALSAMDWISPNSRACHVSVAESLCNGASCVAYRLKDSWTRLGVPSFDATAKLGACVEDTVVVFLVVYRSRNAVSKHAFGKAG